MAGDPLAVANTSGVTYNPTEWRQLQGIDLFSGATDMFGARSGLVPASTARVTISGMTVTVGDIKGVVYTALSTTIGPYKVALPSRTHTVSTAHATLARKDIVYLRVRDHDQDLSTFYDADTVYLAGTASGSPAEPTIPVGTIGVKIATIDVPAASTTPTVTYNSPFVVANGGVLPIRTTSERPPNPWAGMACYRLDTLTLEIYNGSTWASLGEPVTTTSSGLAGATGWSCTWDAWRQPGGFISGMLLVTRTGADLTPSTATGNITPDEVVCTIPSGWRPTTTWSVSGGNGAAGPWEFSVNSSGVVSLRSGAPGYTITTATGIIRTALSWKIA